MACLLVSVLSTIAALVVVPNTISIDRRLDRIVLIVVETHERDTTRRESGVFCLLLSCAVFPCDASPSPRPLFRVRFLLAVAVLLGARATSSLDQPRPQYRK